MRKLWTDASVSYRGTYHQLTGAGLCRCRSSNRFRCGSAHPRRGPSAEPVASVTAGFPWWARAANFEAARQLVEQAATEAGRDPARLGMQGQVSWNGNDDDLAAGIRSWAQAGASHVAVNTMDAGLATVEQHLDALTRAAAIAREFAD